jgi:hypothetical protein
MKNFDEDKFLKSCYPNIELGILKCLANRIGYPEFSGKYERDLVVQHLQIQEQTYNNVLFVLAIYRKPFLTANEALKIIMHVDSTFSLNKRNIERSYYLKKKYQPKQVSDDSKYQKSA